MMYWGEHRNIGEDEPNSKVIKDLLRHYFDRYTENYVVDDEETVRMLLYFSKGENEAGKHVSVENEEYCIRAHHDDIFLYEAQERFTCKRCGYHNPIYNDRLQIVTPRFCTRCGFDLEKEWIASECWHSRDNFPIDTTDTEYDIAAHKPFHYEPKVKTAVSVRSTCNTDFSDFNLYSIEKGNGYVYFICDGQKIKIGKTTNLVQRFSGIQTGNPNRCYFVDVFVAKEDCTNTALEQMFHELFKKYRVCGEWFEKEPVISWLKERWQSKKEEEPLRYNIKLIF